MSTIETQNAEFEAVNHLANTYRALTRTPVVDDDYPEMRHRYETAIRITLDAFRQNGRKL